MHRLRMLRGTPTAALIVVCLALFTDMLIYGMVVPLVPTYVRTFGVSQGAIGLLFGSYAAALLPATPLFGLLADRVGRRGPLLWGLLGLAAATLLFAFAGSFPLLLLARVLQGISGAATWTAGLALLADVAPPQTRGRTMGLAMSAMALGTLVGPTFGGFLYEWGGYRLPFLIAAGIALLDGLARLLLLTDPPYQRGAHTMLWRFARDRRMLLLNGVVALGASVITLLEPTLPLHLERQFGASPGMIGLLFGAITLAYALTSPVAGALADRWGRMPVMLFGVIGVGLLLPLVVLPTTLLVMAGVLFLLGMLIAPLLTPTMAELADTVDSYGQGGYGAAYAIYNAAYAVGMMFGPVSGGLLAQVFGLTTALIVFGVIGWLYALLLLLVLLRRRSGVAVQES
jgi:MFS transporter, DHA1 family, solute carrier family 18 (vesicular amine transporter), member 1/2